QPKARPEACAGAADATIVCDVAAPLRARVTVDDLLRPIREEYVRDGGAPLLLASYEYAGDDPHAGPTDLRIVDPSSGAAMAIHATGARLATARATWAAGASPAASARGLSATGVSCC